MHDIKARDPRLTYDQPTCIPVVHHTDPAVCNSFGYLAGPPILTQPCDGPGLSREKDSPCRSKHLDKYSFSLKNNSDKNVVAYSLAYGRRGKSFKATSQSASGPLIASGGTRWADCHASQEEDFEELTITVVLFEDGSFEGDGKQAARFLAEAEGVRIQARLIILMVSRALETIDAGLAGAVEKLEADLRKMPEAIDKPGALELLRTKFSSFDEPTITGLYERLKSGLYSARDQALLGVGDLRRSIEARGISTQSTHSERVEWIRTELAKVKENFQRTIGN